jgi:hypothetical protein
LCTDLVIKGPVYHAFVQQPTAAVLDKGLAMPMCLLPQPCMPHFQLQAQRGHVCQCHQCAWCSVGRGPQLNACCCHIWLYSHWVASHDEAGTTDAWADTAVLVAALVAVFVPMPPVSWSI